MHAACFLENTIQCASGTATSTGQIAFIDNARQLVIFNIKTHRVTIRSPLPIDTNSSAADLDFSVSSSGQVSFERTAWGPDGTFCVRHVRADRTMQVC